VSRRHGRGKVNFRQCFLHLPKDARTVLHTKLVQIQSIRDVQPGKYHNFGL